MRVLLVEDESVTREGLTMLLELEGAEVVATGSGREALDLVRREPFDVVVTDLGLPDLPGLLLIEQIHSELPSPPPVVVVSGHPEPALGLARAAGAAAVLSKPLDWTMLIRHVGLARPLRVAA